MKKRGRFEREKPKASKKKIGLIIAAVILVLILAIVIGVVSIYYSVLNGINKVDVPKIVYTKPTYDLVEDEDVTKTTETAAATETVVETEPPHVASSEDYINFLVVGQSARPGEDSRMADTMILCTVNTYEKTLTLTSFLRDTLLAVGTDFNGHTIGNIKLTTAYHLGGYYTNGDENEKIAGSMHLINMILNRNFGIEVDHNFEVDFDMFIKVIDLMGGVTLELTEAEANYLNKKIDWMEVNFQPGWADLDGSAALCYARMRKAEGDADSDIKRTVRQRYLIERVINKMKMLNISRVESIVKEVLPMVSTSMSNAEITDTLVTMLKILPELKIQTGGTCPVEGTYRGAEVDIYGDGMYHSVLTDYSVAQQAKLMRAITEGEVAE